MTKYERCKLDLSLTGLGSMKVFGQSMKPIIYTGSTITFQRCFEYEVDDIVFCKVKGRYIDAHKITKTKMTKKGNIRYMIANNSGYENGWTSTIYGKCIVIEPPNEKKKGD